MSVKSCLLGIDFEKPVLLFIAGEDVVGTLHLKGDSRGSKLYDLKMSLIRRTDYVFIETNMSRIKSLNHKLSTLGSEIVCACPIPESGHPTNLPPGQNTSLTFSLPLPASIWSSFVTPNAFTWYGLMLSGKAGSQYGKRETFILKRDIVIIGAVPVEDPQPFKKMLSFPTDGAVSKMKVTFPKTGGIPGESLSFLVQVLNAGSIGVGGVKAQLTQQIEYKFVARLRGARHMKTSLTKMVWQGEGPPTRPGGTSSWKGELPIPFVVPTNLGAEPCPNMPLNYVLSLSLSGVINLRCKVDIRIGTAMVRKEDEPVGDGDSLYCSEISKDLSESQFSLDWDTRSLSSEDSGVCWTILDETASSK